MNTKFDLIAITGEYTNAAGETKKRFTKVGTLWDKGNTWSIKIDQIPVGPWDGWLTPKPAQDKPVKQQGQRYQGLPPDEEVPF